MRSLFSTSSGDASAVRLPVTALSESETELRESVAAFAKKVIAPKVREMDAASKLDAGVLKALFEQGTRMATDSMDGVSLPMQLPCSKCFENLTVWMLICP